MQTVLLLDIYVRKIVPDTKQATNGQMDMELLIQMIAGETRNHL